MMDLMVLLVNVLSIIFMNHMGNLSNVDVENESTEQSSAKSKKLTGPVLDPDPVLDPQYPWIRIWVLQSWTGGSGFGSGSCS